MRSGAAPALSAARKISLDDDISFGTFRCSGRRLRINYLTILYMVTPNPLGQTVCLTGRTNRVVAGTRTAPHASGRVAKKAPLHVNPSQTPAPSLAKTK
jgi:hypothetical protein